MRKDIMVDIETLGNKIDSTIIQISAVSFNLQTGSIYETFNEVADISKNESEISVTGSTLQWWVNTNTELFAKLLTGGMCSSEDVLRHFHRWLSGEISSAKYVYLWGNGILFDNAMIRQQFESIGLNYPIFYRNDRDVRTILELASIKLGKSEKELREEVYDNELVAHDAFNDVANQVKLVSFCYNVLTEYADCR
ncbi:3'-5' exonuclease [Caldifermentibacillus hisashii]|uniref:3'-5' exonuclease n=1 Tax=Caldifermentibacillus hisashii TaxID=996558 RepID=UPI001C126B96|nr:3'-5' exonuclease [Caldifermentibacillus hisashii]MBU5341267.1 3'-5' exoribonuclease [Caldifermentibacillus hisashii]